MRAYFQLLRLPNVFTAMADILLGFLFTHESLAPWPQFVLLLAASSLLYLAGMVLNDVFDSEQDARERPFRPLPSGRVSARTARWLGFGLLLVGVGLAWIGTFAIGDNRPGLVGSLLAACILLYDGALKRTLAGPLAMGACRTLNVLLGMSAVAGEWQAVHYVVAGAIGLYIVGVTVFARTEARESSPRQLALGLAILMAGVGLLASLPAWVSGQEWPEIHVPQTWFLVWAAVGLLVSVRAVRAIVAPQPQLVQAAVKRCIFSLVILDAAASLAVHEPFWALVILALLVPTMTLGRWIYAT